MRTPVAAEDMGLYDHGGLQLVRLFVAVWAPSELRRALELLPRPKTRAVSWTLPDQWHITLCFIGEVETPQYAVEAFLDRSAACPPPQLATAGPKVVLSKKRLIVLPVSGLGQLAQVFQQAFGAQRKFFGHLTIGRLRHPHPIEDSWRAILGIPVECSWEVTTVDMIASLPDGHRRRYEVLGTIRLSA